MKWLISFSAGLAMVLAMQASVYAAEKAPKIWIQFEDEPTGIFPTGKGYRILFAHHAGPYYLLKSDPAVKEEHDRIRKAILGEKMLSVEAEATYQYLRRVELETTP